MMKKFGIKKIYIFFSSAFIFIIHIPFVFAKTKPLGKFFSGSDSSQPIAVTENTLLHNDADNSLKFKLYDSLRLGSLGLGRQVFDYALRGFNYMKEMGTLANDQIISIVDFSKPSSKKGYL